MFKKISKRIVIIVCLLLMLLWGGYLILTNHTIGGHDEEVEQNMGRLFKVLQINPQVLKKQLTNETDYSAIWMIELDKTLSADQLKNLGFSKADFPGDGVNYVKNDVIQGYSIGSNDLNEYLVYKVSPSKTKEEWEKQSSHYYLVIQPSNKKAFVVIYKM